MQPLDFVGSAQWAVKGSFFRYESATPTGLDLGVKVHADGMDLGVFYPGDGIKLDKPAQRWEVDGIVTTTKGKVRIGMGTLESQRITGEVSVIDQGAAKSMAGLQFFSSATVLADVANVSAVGVRPVNKTAVIKRFWVQSDVAGDVFVAKATTAGTAIYSSAAIRNKDLAAADCDTQITSMRWPSAANPTAGEVPGWTRWIRLLLSANVPMELPLSTPLVLRPGTHLLVSGEALNRKVSLIADGEEF